MKLGIVGSGFAGQIIAYTAAMRALCDEIYLVDINKKKAESQTMDLNDARSLYAHDIKSFACEYDDLNICDIIVLTSGGIPESSDRLDEFKENKNVVRDYVHKIVGAGFKGIFIVVSNPCDVMAYEVFKESKFPASKVIGSGTSLDSLRLKTILSQKLNISPKSIEAYILGEHGESQFVAWSQVKISGIGLDEYLKENKIESFPYNEIEMEVRERGWKIYLGKGSTQYGIGNTVSNIISAIYHNENVILNVSSLLNGEYGMEDLYISSPCLINKDGISKTFELKLNESEIKKLHDSGKIIKDYLKILDWGRLWKKNSENLW